MKKFFLLIMTALSVVLATKASEPKLPESYNFQRGCEAIEKGNYEDGLKYLQLELKDNPKNGYAWAWLMAVYYGSEEYGNVIDAGYVALKYIPKKDSYYIGFVHRSLSVAYNDMGNKDKALEEITEAIKVQPEDVDYISERAEMYYGSGLCKLADADYEKCIALQPGNAIGYMGLGRDRLYQRRFDEAIEQFSYAIRLSESYSQAYAFRADCYSGLRDYDSAARDLVKALEIDSNDRAFASMQYCNDTCYQKMVVLMKVKSAKPAETMDWDYYLGVAHQQHGHYLEAIQSYLKSFDRDASSFTLGYIAGCYGEMANYDKARQYVDKALSMDSTRLDLLLEKADYYYYGGDAKGAIETLGDFIAAEPELYYGYYRRGFYKDNIRDVDGAIDDYTYSIVLEPGCAYGYLGRGDMYLLKGDAAAAKADYRKVVELDKEVLESGNSRQYGYLALGMRDSAELWLQSILEKYPTGDNYYDAACLMARMGEKERSIGYLTQAFENGYHEIQHLENDDDMNLIRGEQAYKDLIDKYQKIFDEKNKVGEDDGKVSHIELETTEIPFRRDGSMMMIQCTINNLPLHFIFDTGASDVSISDVEANFMLKNGYLRDDDIIGKAHYQTADGNISEGTVINLKRVDFGGLKLTDIKASVVKSQRAPLLLGQSVLERLGKIEIDNTGKVLKVTHNKK